MEKIIHMDERGRQWQIGSIDGTFKITKNARHVILPLRVKPMYPVGAVDKVDLIYSHCAKCGAPVSEEGGTVILEFVENAWGVRIGCEKCCGSGAATAAATTVQICNISTILTPIIEAGWSTPFLGCTVCERTVCHDLKCKDIISSGILTTSPIDDMLEHFYRVRLDILSPLICTNCCNFCKSPADRICRTCRIVVYCNYGCKRKDGHLGCTSFIEIWRSAQIIFPPS
jgi:hypothetical protein